MTHFRKEKSVLFFIIVLGAFVFSSNIWGASIYILDESKNSVCAREMLDRNDFIVPTYNGELRTDKPPLHYFFMMLSYSVFGVNEFGARFFSVIAGIGTLLITFFYTRKFLDFKTAIWSIIVLISSLHFALEFHLAVPDPYLIFFISLSLFSFYDFYISRKIAQLLIFYIALGLGTLTKGPIALGLPGLIALIFLIANRDFKFKTIRKFKPILGILIYCTVTLPWYILVYKATDGEWTSGFFFKHNIERFSGSMEGHGGTFLLPTIFVILGLLPFSIFIFRAFQNSWKSRRENKLYLFLIIVSFVIVGFFSISGTKLPNYPMPSYPFIAIMIGSYISGTEKKNLKSYFIISFLIGIFITSGAYIGLHLEKDLSHLKNYAFLLLIISIASLIGFYFSKIKENIKALATLSAGWIITTLLIFYIIYPKIDSTNPVAETRRIVGDIENVAFYGRFNPSFTFYAKKVIPRLNSVEEINRFFEENENALLLTNARYEDQLKGIIGAKEIVRTKDLFEIRITLVYSNINIENLK